MLRHTLPKSIITLFLITTNASAAVSSLTQVDSLSTVDDFLGTRTWDDEFSRPLEISGDWNECLAGGRCEGSVIHARIEHHDNAVVTMTTTVGETGQPQSSKMEQSTWEANRGNFVRMDIASKQSYGYQITVNTIEPTTFTVMIGGESVELAALLIKATGIQGSGQRLSVEYTVTKEIPGYGQIALLREQHDSPFAFVRTRTLKEVIPR